MLRLTFLRTLTGIAALTVLMSTAPVVLAQNATDAGEQLANQARYWEGQNRIDLARENWLKLLRSTPDNPSALAGLANAEAVSGRAAAAQVYLDRLKETHPNHPDVRRLEATIRQGSINPDKLAPARVLARQGKYQESVDAYRAAFGKELPGGRLGLEYYQTLAGTENGWEPARAGIAKLVQDNPDDSIYKLAYAQHLTYRESSRRQGIQQLSALSTQDPSVAVPARQAWRQALIWLGAKRSDEALYQEYQRRFGDDAEVGGRFAELRESYAPAATPQLSGPEPAREPTIDELRGKLIRDGFAALDASQLDVASDHFINAMTQYGESADALGGLGIIRLRQQAYPEARDLLERATGKDRKRASRWKEALDTAKFWETVRIAENARKAGDNATAVRELRRAIASDPKRAAEETSVPSSLADVLVEQGDLAEAEKIYRGLLRTNPDSADALRGLIGVLTTGKRLQEAIQLAESAPANVRSQLGSFSLLKAQVLREQAADAVRARDELRAETLLKDALLLDPETPWTRLDLARIYQRQGRIREANTLVDTLLASAASSPVQPDAVFIKASLLAEQQDFLGGLQLLEQVPAGSRTPAMTDLQKRLWVQYQAQRAGVYSRAGAQQEAQQILSQLETFTEDMPELLGAIAGAYADLGDEARALRYMRLALSRNGNSDVGLRLAYAGLLFKLRQDTEFEVVMDDLLRRSGKLTEQQNVDLANLRVGYRLRQADLVREEGDLARAYEYLEPLIRVNPNDPRLMMALARLYNDSKDFDKAYVIYERVLQANGEELDAYKGAIGAALALNRVDDADALLERAFAVDPNNPRLYALAGKAAKARGDEGRALALFQQALRIDAQQAGLSAGGSLPAGSRNSQPLLQLVDPGKTYLRAPSRVMGMGELRPPPATVVTPRFFKTHASLAFRESTKKKAAPLTAKPALYRVKADALQTPPRQLPRGDVALPASYAAWSRRLIKVSTPPKSREGMPASATLTQPSGYWAEQPRAQGTAPAYKYVESLTLPQAGTANSSGGYQQPQAPRMSDFPAPRQVSPTMSPRLSRPNGSLREELLGEIGDINRRSVSTPGGSYTTAPQAPAPYGVPASGAYQQRGSSVYEVPRIEGGDYLYQGAPVREAAPPPAYSTPFYSTQPSVPPPPPSTIRQVTAPQTRSNDPMLTTPEFVIDRNRTDSADRRVLLKEIAELRASRTPYAEAGLALRSRDGSQGLDRLFDIEAPVEVGFPATEGGRFKVRAVPVYLDAGTVSGRDLPGYGALALALSNGLGSPNLRYDNAETGIAVGLAYEAGSFKADIGTSPLGFPVESIVGGINWRPKMERLSFKIDLARRSVTDSLLSYAGLRDPATGLTYGGVARTGGRVDMAYDLGKYGVYANAGYSSYDGQNVPQNSSVEVGAGLYARAIETRSVRATYGLNITTFGYDKNLRRFSFGHGGYFSPQSYLAVSIPVEVEGYRNRFSYKLGGSIGIQAFKEDGQSIYPGDQGLQDALDLSLVDYTGTLPIPGGYPSQRQTGVGFTAGAQFEYLLDPNLAVGSRFALDNARDYKEASAIGYLRYMFYPQRRASFPPNLLIPYFNFGDPRL